MLKQNAVNMVLMKLGTMAKMFESS